MFAKYWRLRLHYSWVILVITFLTMLVAAGMRSMPGIMMMPLEKAFGWSDASISLSMSLNLIVYGLSGPFTAALMQRLGIGRVILTALVVVAVTCGLSLIMTAVWQLDLLWGLGLGVATGALSTILGAIVAERWFVKNRSLVVGLLSASNSTGNLIFLPLLAQVVTSNGWRAVAMVTGGVALGIVPFVLLFFRDQPQDLSLRAYGADPEVPDVAPVKQANPFIAPIKGLVQAARKRDFWLVGGSFFICGFSTYGLIGTHLIPAEMDHGMPEVLAASTLAIMGLFDLIGTTVSGWLTDRVDARLLLFWYYGLRGISLLFLPLALNSSYFVLLVFAVFYGLDWIATVPPTVRLSGNILGRENVGIVFAWIIAAHQFGGSAAAAIAGLSRTYLGSYTLAFVSSGLLCMVASGMSISVGRRFRPTSKFKALREEVLAQS
jgi:sugar phosphate permease